jgi:hypothetical protein
MSLTLAAFILVVILVVGWFALGTHFNVRKGNDSLRWLQDGLPLVGEKTTLRWLGSSVVELKILQAKAPFHHAELLFVLEPRDVAVIWWLARLRGRRDLFIFRGTLRKQPQLELEILDTTSWPTRGTESQFRAKHWMEFPLSPPLVAYAPHRQAPATQLVQAVDLSGCPLVRLSIRQTEPNIEIQWRLAHIRKYAARDVIETLRQLIDRL